MKDIIGTVLAIGVGLLIIGIALPLGLMALLVTGGGLGWFLLGIAAAFGLYWLYIKNHQK